MAETIAAKAILCDIEGTTTSIQFVKDVLFPYSLEHVKGFIESNWEKLEVQEAIKALIQQAQTEIKNNVPDIVPIFDKDMDKEEIIEKVVHNFHVQVKNDLKVAPVKNLQGLIWEEGYKSDSVKGHLYNDVPTAFADWAKKGIQLYIYSSGSVHAQKLLYEFTDHGNLLPYIKGHFDTKVGMKQEAQSYENILKEIQFNGDDVVFFTDIAKEAYAAKLVGIRTILLDRPGNGPLNEEDCNTFKVIKSFEDVNIVLSK